MTTPTDWCFQTAETEAAWTQEELGEDGWQLYQQLMVKAAPAPASAPGGAAGTAPPASGAAAPPSTTAAVPASAKEPGVPPPDAAAPPAPPAEPGASLPPDTNEAPAAPLAADSVAPTAVVWPAMRYLSAELVGQFVTAMLALDPPGLTKRQVNDWVKRQGCPYEEGVIRKGLLNWLRAAGVLENPNTGLPPRLTETDLATIAQRLATTPYHADMEL